jgi:hypothetical protein
MNMVVLRVQNMFVSSVICLVSYEYVIYAEIPVSDSETGKRHVVHLEATTCRNLNQTRGPTNNEKVAQPKMTRGQTAARHVA